MAESPVFTATCNELDQRTSLSGLEARGTIRIALKSAGLEAKSVTVDQMNVVLEQVLPKELALRGVDDTDDVCQSIASSIQNVVQGSSDGETPDTVFERLGRSSTSPA